MFVVTEREGVAAPNDEENLTQIVKEVVHKRFSGARGGSGLGLTDIKECKMEHDHKT